MNPIQSDLAIRVALFEAEATLVARQRAALARQASTGGSLPKLAATMVKAVRYFVDPRGYTLAQLRQRTPLDTGAGTAQVDEVIPAVAGNQGTPVTILMANRRPSTAPASLAGETATAA